jgi:hypothetical protein
MVFKTASEVKPFRFLGKIYDRAFQCPEKSGRIDAFETRSAMSEANALAVFKN